MADSNSTTAHSISISIRRPSDSPVYIAGTFSEPKWELLELSVKDEAPKKGDADSTTEYTFQREFDVPEGNYEYKFREGKEGDWFVDEGVASGRLFFGLGLAVDADSLVAVSSLAGAVCSSAAGSSDFEGSSDGFSG